MSVPTIIQPGIERELKNRANLAQTVHDSLVMAYRGLLKFRRNPEQFVDVLFMPIIFTLMFTYIFGGAISGNVTSYLPIIIPGILVQAVIQASVTTGVQLRDDMDKGVFSRFKSLPIARIAPLAGALIADILRYATAATLTVLMGIVMGLRPEGGLIGVVGSLLLVMGVAWAISWIFALFGVLARSAASVQGISMMILFPLTFLSNAFVPVDTLPSWLQVFAKLNPISHLISAVRDLMNHGVIGNDFWISLLGAVIIVAIFAPLAVRAYMRKA